MTLMVPVRAASTAALVTLACLAPLHASAQDASPWIKDTYSSVRLIAGSRSGGVLLGGIGFQLQPGWKTYWRTPGDPACRRGSISRNPTMSTPSKSSGLRR
jgi:DsbC/DsbD-like thiol-disulfide interchange protein